MRLGVVKLVPVPKLDPPVALAYQFIMPALAVALSVTDPVPQIDAEFVVLIVGIAVTVTVPVAIFMHFPQQIT